jgi:hypothetical protein
MVLDAVYELFTGSLAPYRASVPPAPHPNPFHPSGCARAWKHIRLPARTSASRSQGLTRAAFYPKVPAKAKPQISYFFITVEVIHVLLRTHHGCRRECRVIARSSPCSLACPIHGDRRSSCDGIGAALARARSRNAPALLKPKRAGRRTSTLWLRLLIVAADQAIR